MIEFSSEKFLKKLQNTLKLVTNRNYEECPVPRIQMIAYGNIYYNAMKFDSQNNVHLQFGAILCRIGISSR